MSDGVLPAGREKKVLREAKRGVEGVADPHEHEVEIGEAAYVLGLTKEQVSWRKRGGTLEGSRGWVTKRSLEYYLANLAENPRAKLIPGKRIGEFRKASVAVKNNHYIRTT